MAFISIKNGKVNRTFYDGKGASVVEEFTKRDGETGKKYYTAFFEEPHGLSEGDTGTFSGLHSARIREYEAEGEIRQSLDVVLNNARFEADSGGGGESPF